MSTDFEIEKGIPLPARPNKVYPFDQMEVGDSFLIPDHKYRAVQAAASRAGKCSGKRFTVRNTKEGYRCWRIE